MVRVRHLDHVAITVSDLERSIAWYREHLGLERRFEELWDGPPIMLAAGDTALALFPAQAGDALSPHRIRMLHVAFRADRADFEAARAHLQEAGLEYRAATHENCWSLYFTDPDGHRLEITTYDAP